LFLESQITGNLDPRDGQKYLELVRERDEVIFDFAVNAGFLAAGSAMGKRLLGGFMRMTFKTVVNKSTMKPFKRALDRIHRLALPAPRNEETFLRHWARLSLPPDATTEQIERVYLRMKDVEERLRHAKRLSFSRQGEPAEDEVAAMLTDIIDNGMNAF